MTSIQIVPLCIDILVSGITLAGYGAVLIYVSGWLGVASSILLVLIMAVIYVAIGVRSAGRLEPAVKITASTANMAHMAELRRIRMMPLDS